MVDSYTAWTLILYVERDEEQISSLTTFVHMNKS